MAELTEREQEMLRFERGWWKRMGSKEGEIRRLFGLSPTRYFQQLNALINRPEAFVFDPMLVKRLQRLREQGRRRSRIS